MEKQEKTEEIRKWCIEANSEIGELSFGCHVIVSGIREDNPGCEKDIVVDSRLKDGCVGLGYFGLVSVECLEIIGRPVRLADVLYAISKIDLRFFDHCHLTLLGTMCLKTGEDIYWNLLKDNIEEQSEETLDFLISIKNGAK